MQTGIYFLKNSFPRDKIFFRVIVNEKLQLEAPSEAESIVADYRHLGQVASGSGIVTVRQRPGTANAVVLITLEDETGNVNVIIWPSLVEQQRKEVMGAALLGVYGVWQCQNNVRNLVAKRLIDLSHLLGELDIRSRNFH